MASILVQSFAETVTTLFLFTKSDIKTAVIPASFFAIAAAPMTDISRLPHVIFWIWIHILQFDVANQIFGYEEDAINKKDRPIPSGRITLNAARTLRWALLPLCIGISALYSIETAYASTAWAILIFIYNEMHGHSEWILRNFFYASGFACFEVGASLIAGSNRHTLDAVGARAVIVSAGIFATTCHTQDFKDRNGDRAIGRQTIPILFPRISRWTVMFPMVTWSIGLTVIWQLDEVVAGLVIALASYVGGRYLHMKSVPDDQISFYWYNVWISIAHALPGYYRVRQL